MPRKPKPAPKRAATPDVLGTATPLEAASFDEITLEASGDAIVLAHTREAVIAQAVAMGASTAAFVVFILIVLPALHLSSTGTILWTIVGTVLLAVVGLATQAQTRTTRIRMDAVGLRIGQGSTIDREQVELTWNDVAGVLLEPVSAKDPRKGMQLRIELRDAEPVDTLVDVTLGDLTEARRMILERWHLHRAPPPTPAASQPSA